MRPAAGALGLVALPLHGIFQQFRNAVSNKGDTLQTETRRIEGREAVQASSKVEREAVIAKFKSLQATTRERQKKLSKLAEAALLEDQDVETSTEDNTEAHEAHGASDTDAESPESVMQSSKSTPQGNTHADDSDAQFERDLEIAKQLSLAEQRGFERGLAMSQ